jgi:uncharacterized protein
MSLILLAQSDYASLRAMETGLLHPSDRLAKPSSAKSKIGPALIAGLLFCVSAIWSHQGSAQEPKTELEPLIVDIDPQANMRRERSRESYQSGHDALAAKRTYVAYRYFNDACNKGDAKSCFNVATLIRQEIDAQPSGSPADPAKIKAVADALKISCERGFQRACAGLAQLVMSDNYGMQDLPKAVSLAQAACAADEAAACADLAELYYVGEGVPVDRAQAAALFRKSCDANGPASACFNYAVMLDKRQFEDFAPARAFEYYRTACRGGSNEACINLAADYLEGQRVSFDLDIAEGLLEQACEREALTACSNLGSLLVDYRRTPEAQVAAVSHYRKACDGGNGSGCRGLGNLAQVGVKQAGRPRDAIGLFVKGCEMGASTSCYNAGLTHWSGFKALKRPELALQWFAKGCELKSASICAGAAIASYSAEPEPREAAIAQSRRWLDHARSLDVDNPLVQAIDDWLRDGANPEGAPAIPVPAATSPEQQT